MLSQRLLSVLLIVKLVTSSVNGQPTQNHEYIEDVLDSWLSKFNPDAFIMDEEVNELSEELQETVGSANGTTLLPWEESNEDLEGNPTSTAPITVGIKRTGGFLDPELDYTVKIKSLVADRGSVLVTLTPYKNKTTCGVGGFSLSGEGSPTANQTEEGNVGANQPSTVVTFAVDVVEAESTSTWTMSEEDSTWEEIGSNLFWAEGNLGQGGSLDLTYTPPECGCLLLSAYYAMPIGQNLTLVVGPKAYPLELEKMLCIDSVSIENLMENLVEGEEENEISEITKIKGAGKKHRGRGKWAGRKAQMDRKGRKHQARQSIRQAGKRVTQRRVRQELKRQVRQEQNTGPETRPGHNRRARQNQAKKAKWARKQARKLARKQAKKGKKPWKKNKKQQRKVNRQNRRRNRQNMRNNANATDSSVSTTTEVYEDYDITETFDNSTEPQQEEEEILTDEDSLADILLGEDEQEEQETTTAAPSVVRNRIRGGRRMKRMKNKQWKRKKGVKFCCKQGIRFKKSMFLMNNNTEANNQTIQCDGTNDVVTTFAQHKFDMEESLCESKFENCCSKFTMEVWESFMAKKANKKAKKQQRKGNRQQQKKQKRQQKQQRKQRRRERNHS